MPASRSCVFVVYSLRALQSWGYLQWTLGRYSAFSPVKFCWNLKTKEPGFTDHMEFKTSKRSSKMRTPRFCSFTGVYPTPPVTLSLGYPTLRYPTPEYSTPWMPAPWIPYPYPGYPISGKEHGTRNQRYPTPFPCEQTDRHLWKHYLPATTVVL